MAVDIKVAPEEKLELVQTLIVDTSINSEYFNISELPDSFSGGKNAFLIAGSDLLQSNSEIKIQIRDAAGNIVYHEFSDGSPNEYYEGNSKVVAVYIYPTETAFGPATITILGELNTKNVSVPIDWQNKYNVKWQGRVNINPALSNTTRVRFKKRPVVTITELLQPLYSIISGSKVASLVTQSFASITVNQLDTFAGDVARVKVYRTSEGDISDYDLIQDISIEAKNLLTTYELSGSVVGNAGTFGPDTLSKVWNTSSLYAVLDATNVENGLQLSGSGKFSFTSSLNLLSSNTYELQLDAFYTGSTATNLVAYISGTQNGEIPITTFSGSIPTKNFETTITAFKIPKDEPTASLYLSQSSGTNQWHVGNISLNLSQDTAFSPNEISFITSMPTILGNDIFNFKFEFYDINNNYVPVAVTQSAVFNGGFSLTQALISGSTSSSNAALTALSQSVSSSISATSQSVSSSISVVSASLSSSISQSTFTSSLFTSASVSTLSGSVSTSINLVSGALSSSINVVSGSVVNLSSSVSASLSTLSSSLSTSLSNISSSVSNSSFTVYSASAYLEKFIFTDENGKLNKTPTTSSAVNGLYLGSTYLGFYSGSSWKTYMDNQGDFYLTGSNNNFLAWNSSLGTLQVQGQINIQEGGISNAATTSSVATAAANAVISGSNAANNVSTSLAPNIFTNANGLVNRPPVTLVGVASGLYLGPTYLGYYNGSDWKTYMQNNGNFYLSGPGTNSLSWVNGVLTISGAITVTGGNAATSTDVSTAQSTAISTASGDATTKANAAQAAAIASAASDATTKANSARTAAELFATGVGNNAVTSGSAAATAAQTAAINQAKADASASVTLLANGNWTAGSGTFITSNSISSPVIAGNAGYISSLFKVGQNGITLDGVNKKIYIGNGDFNNSNTAFYVDNSSNFSLGNKLTWNGTTLTIDGAANIGGSTATTVAAGAALGAAALQSGANISLLSNNSGFQDASSVNSAAKTAGSVGGWTIASTTLSANSGRTVLTNDGTIRLKDTNNVSKVLLDYGTTSTADPANATAGTIAITGFAAGTATYQNGALTGQGPNGYLQGAGWPYAATWNVDNVITAPLTAAFELTLSFPVSSLRKTTWISGTKTSGPLVDMRLYVKDSGGNSVYSGFGGAEYVNSPVFDADFAGNFYAQIDPANPPANIVLYMSGVNMVAGQSYTVTVQYIVYNLAYDNYMTIDYYMPNINIAYNASVASTVLNQVGLNVGQDTDRYFLTRPDFLNSMDLTTFPTNGSNTNNSFQDRRTVGHIGGTFLLLNHNAIEWHNSMQRIYINNASYPRSNRSAGGNFMTSHFFGGYNRAFQMLRAYAMFEPDASTNCTSVYTDIWNIGYSFNIEQITYVTTNTWQVFFVEALQDISTYANVTADRGYYGVVVAANGTATGPVPQIVRVFDTYNTSFKIELTGEDSSGTRINILVYK